MARESKITHPDLVKSILKKAIEDGPQTKPSTGLKAQLEEQSDLIITAYRQGHTMTNLAEMLRAGGIEVSVDTLRTYLSKIVNTFEQTSSMKRPATQSKTKTKRKVALPGETTHTTKNDTKTAGQRYRTTESDFPDTVTREAI